MTSDKCLFDCTTSHSYQMIKILIREKNKDSFSIKKNVTNFSMSTSNFKTDL